MKCSVCGGGEFQRIDVLWDALVSEWQLSPAEVDYVNRQQGETCVTCGANLRSMALADAIRAAAGTQETLDAFVRSPAAGGLSVLEVNEAGTLSASLRQCGGYRFGAYPEVDLHALPFDDNTFDLIIHSDTLEHVEDPVHALTECHRVLKPGGALCFTVPIIVGRLSRGRAGLASSYHGSRETATDDLIVRTEFGADAWTYVMQAGFSQVTLHAVEYPAATAMRAIK